MTAFSKLQPASFDGIQFPVRTCTVKGSLRHHVHEYPHAWGGAFENLERKLYEIRMTSPMMATFARYPGLWPGRWNALRKLFEKGEPKALTIPTIGTIQARCIEWPETMDAKIQSGVMTDLMFIEDQSQQFLIEKMVEVDQQRINDMLIRASGAFAEADDRYLNGLNRYEQGLLDSILSVANDILSVKDNVDFYGQMIESKVMAFDALVREADASVRAFDHPENWDIVDAMRDLWESIQQLGRDIQGNRQTLTTWTVPMTMSITDISVRLYGDNSMAVTLLQCNDVPDAFAVPAGFPIKYYPDVKAA